MDVLLTENVVSLGKTGQVVKVKDGYARNFLIPQQKACVVTAANIKYIEQMEKKKKSSEEAQKKEANVLAEKLAKASCTVAVEVNDQEKLYGSINESDIAKALEVEGFSIDKKNIMIENPIEELGIFEIPVQLHADVTAKLRLWVTKK